jgi:hypothetical protein
MLRPTIFIILAAMIPGAASAQNPDSTALLRIHQTIISAHRANNVEAWMQLEAVDMTSINGGRVSFPTSAQRHAGRTEYLASSKFEVYRDLRPPIVRISRDGTLGWLIAEVEVKGTETGQDGASSPFHDVWAWVELYEKIDGAWKIVGNASNHRPGNP